MRAVTLVLLGSVFLRTNAMAAAINTDTALPVHRGEFLWREQVRFLKAEDATRDLEVIAVPSVLVYGVTEKFALIGVVPYLDKTSKMGGAERGDNGLGDSTLLGRYQVFQFDRPGETFRAQVLGGLKFPTGRDDESDSAGRLPQPLQLGSGSYDPIVAGVFTWQRLRWQADFDVAYKISTEANNFRFGNTLAHDAAFQYRLWPWQLPERGVPSFVYGLLELNGIWAERNELNGGRVGDSGGYTLFVSPGLQYVTRRWVAELSVQLPVVQALNGNQLETDYILVAGFRVQF
ncbi:MAG: transporter [Verrucomicrobiales bacterium]|nr:transporter [Verrucomicrobiales bacterium]